MASTKLLVKNLPPQFTDADKTDFLKLFGGDEVVVMSPHGKLRNCCFVTFPDVVMAKQALETLHQFEVLDRLLVAEYAKQQHEREATHKQSEDILKKKIILSDEKSSLTKKKEKEANPPSNVTNDQTNICSKLNVNYPFPEHLRYKYPDANVTILTNIANAMASVPKFYTQVLHLMNKMNLPAPFGGPTLTPPIPGTPVPKQDVAVDTSDLGDIISSDESELESDSEAMKPEIYKTARLPSDTVRKRKRLKVMKTTEQEKLHIVQLKKPEPVESAFELPSSSTHRTDMTLAMSIKEAVEGKNQPPVHFSVFDERGDFGKLKPTPQTQEGEQTEGEVTIKEEEEDEELEEEEDEEEGEEEGTDYISLKTLQENRISEVEIKSMNQFKNYTLGERTNRLYIKNLAKQVVESDLRFIFRRFVRGKKKGEGEGDGLDIRLMQEGRMKGQAFITFPNEDIAEQAVDAVHGYVLHEKPMVIQYGRAGK